MGTAATKGCGRVGGLLKTRWLQVPPVWNGIGDESWGAPAPKTPRENLFGTSAAESSTAGRGYCGAGLRQEPSMPERPAPKTLLFD